MKNKKWLLIISLIIVILIVIIGINLFNNNQKVKVYYRTYTREKGWSKWSKDGETSGNGEYDILNIEIKVKSKLKGEVGYKLYQDGKWTKDVTDTKNKTFEDKKTSGIKITFFDTLYKKYNIFYRTYNDEDKWLEWATDYQISGNKNKNIKKIQIKTLEKGSSVDDFLEDYYETEIKSKNFDKEGE